MQSKYFVIQKSSLSGSLYLCIMVAFDSWQQSALRVTGGSSQILWEVRQEERHRRRRVERSHIPNPSGSVSVGRWWRTTPKRVPGLLWGSTSAGPLLPTEVCKRRITLLPKPAQNTRPLILWLTCTSVCVWIICTRHPKPTPNSMSAGTGVKVAAGRMIFKWQASSH